MTATLCIETSGPHCSLALAVGGQIYCREQLLERTHNQYLLPLLDDLFTQAGCAPVDLDLLSFGCGPGSFTGVRIAAAAVQAIATASSAKVVALSSSWVLAATALRDNPELEKVLCCIASRGQAYYLSLYDRDGQASTGGLTVVQVLEDELADNAPTWLTKDCAHWQAGKVGIAGGAPVWLPAPISGFTLGNLYPRAEMMVAAAQLAHAAGASLAPELALPRYFSGDSPWRKSKPAAAAS